MGTHLTKHDCKDFTSFFLKKDFKTKKNNGARNVNSWTADAKVQLETVEGICLYNSIYSGDRDVYVVKQCQALECTQLCEAEYLQETGIKGHQTMSSW